MEYNSTGLSVIPDEKIQKDIWNSFVCEFPLCSNLYQLPDNQKYRYKFMSALMMANIFDALTNWQQLSILQNIYESLNRIANDIDQPPIIKQQIVNIMNPFYILITNLQPFDYNIIDHQQQDQKNIQKVQEYLQNKRKYIYSYLDNEQGINTLFQLSRGIALSEYLKPDNEMITSIRQCIKQLNKEEIIKKLCSDDLEINSLNYFILEDYEVIAISHLFNFPIYFFINYFDQQSNYVTKRRIQQQQNQEKKIAFLLEIYQNKYTIRILQSNQDILYIQNIINHKQQLFQIDQSIVEIIQQIIESILKQASNDFCNLNKFWITKVLQIIQLGEAQTLIANKQTIKINEQFSKDSFNLFQLLNLDQKIHQEFVLSSEQNLIYTEELIENTIISQVTIIRDYITEIVNKYMKLQSNSPDQIVLTDKASVPKDLVKNSLFSSLPNQITNQSQQQIKLNLSHRPQPKVLENDFPQNIDIHEQDCKNSQSNLIQNVSFQQEQQDIKYQTKEITQNQIDNSKSPTTLTLLQQSYNKNDKLRSTKIINQSTNFRSEVIYQKSSANQIGLENTFFEEILNLQNDYFVSLQNRSSHLRAKSDILLLKSSGKKKDSLGFVPKKQMINQNNNSSNSQIMRQNVKHKKSEIDNLHKQIHNSEALNESKSLYSISPFFCPICQTEINEASGIRNLHDDHKICQSCLEDWIKVKFNSGQWNFKYFKCPIQLNNGDNIKPCQRIIDQQEIKNVLTPEEFSKLAERAIKNGIIDITCPNQSCKTSIKGMPPQNQNELRCPLCSHKICCVCKNLDHGASKCPQRLDEIKVALLDERVSCCPGCLEIYMKNDGCEHVSCTNCLIEFCFACSAFRPPIIAHGAHFHRVGCNYRFPLWTDKSKKIENLGDEYLPDECEDCKQNQKACPRPMSLDDFKNLAHLNF